MKSRTLQIRVGILAAVIVIFAMGYRAMASRVSQPIVLINLPAPVNSPVVSQ